LTFLLLARAVRVAIKEKDNGEVATSQRLIATRYFTLRFLQGCSFAFDLIQINIKYI